MTAGAMREVPLLDHGGLEAPPARRPRPRIKTAGFPALPLDIGEFYAADLDARQRGVLIGLKVHLWLHGALPRTAKGLAEIGRVHVRSWRSMEAAIAPHFDIDEDGRWRHYDLEAERADAIEKRAKRAAANARNADLRWGREKATGGDDGTDPDDRGHANGNANRIANDAQPGVEPGSLGLPYGEPRVPDTGGQSDRQTRPQDKEKIGESDGRTDAQRGSEPSRGTSVGNANKDANGATEDDGKSAIGNAGADAKGDATPHATAGANEEGKSPATGPSDAEIARVLRAGAGDKIPAHLLTRDGGIATIRSLMGEGCDFARDIAPAFIAGARGLQKPLNSLRAQFLRDMAIANRDEALEQKASKTAASRHFLIKPGMAEWDAWLKFKNRKSLPLLATGPSGRFDDKGYYVPTQWPPGWVQP